MFGFSRETQNTIQVSLSFMILFCSILPQEFLNEPLVESYSHANYTIQLGDGYTSLAIVYLFNTLSCPLAPSVVSVFSAKWTMVIGMFATLVFQIGYLVMNRYFLFASAAFVGIGTTFLWVGQGQYITQNCSETNLERNTAFQWAFFKLSLIIGGLFVLLTFADTSIGEAIKSGRVKYIKYTFWILDILAIIITMVLPKGEGDCAKRITIVECVTLAKTPRVLLLSVFFLYLGFVRSFWVSIFPTCIKFTTQLTTNHLNTTAILALAMITTGVGQMLGSTIVWLCGARARHARRSRIIGAAVGIHIALFAAISLTFPASASHHETDESGAVFAPTVFSIPATLICSGVLGFGDAILQTQVYAYTAELYKHQSSHIFSIFKFFSGIASTIIFLIAVYVNLTTHLIILTIFGIFSIISCHFVQKTK